MDYPHWISHIIVDEQLQPIAILARTKSEAACTARLYADFKNSPWPVFDVDTLRGFDSDRDLCFHTGLRPSDLIFLTEDDRGKCLAYRPCGAVGGQCDVEYFPCGCFV